MGGVKTGGEKTGHQKTSLKFIADKVSTIHIDKHLQTFIHHPNNIHELFKSASTPIEPK